GPRLTITTPSPSGTSSTLTVSGSSAAASPVASTGWKVMVCSVGRSPPTGCSNAAPHDEQKFEPAGLRCPHWLQNTPLIVLTPHEGSRGDADASRPNPPGRRSQGQPPNRPGCRVGGSADPGRVRR